MRNLKTIPNPLSVAAVHTLGVLLTVAGLSQMSLLIAKHSPNQNDQLWILSIAFSPDGKALVASGNEPIVWVWDTKTGKLKLTLKGHKRAVRSVAFSPNGRTIASASYDKTIRLWDSGTGKQKRELKALKQEMNTVSFSPDGKIVVGASYYNVVGAWDVDTGEPQFAHSGYSAAFSPNGKILATGDGPTLDTTTGMSITGIYNPRTGEYTDLSKGQKDQNKSQKKTSISLWNVESGLLQRMLTGHKDAVNSIAFSPDSKTVASASTDFTVKLWDVQTGELKLTLPLHSDMVYSVAFSPDGKMVASAGRELTVRVWDSQTGALQREFPGAFSVAFSPDSKTVAIGNNHNMVALWDVQTGELKMGLTGH